MEQIRSFSTASEFAAIASGRNEALVTATAFASTRTVSATLLKHSHRGELARPQRRPAHHRAAPRGEPRTGVLGRARRAAQDTTLAVRRHLPAMSGRLGQGRSVVKPSSRSGVAWIVSRATGEVTAQCSVPVTLAARDITESDLANCSNVAGALVRGFIRFSLGAVPDALRPHDAPMALSFRATASTRCEPKQHGR